MSSETIRRFPREKTDMDDGRMVSRRYYSMNSVYRVVEQIARGEGTGGLSRDSQIIACRWLGVGTITQNIAEQWLQWVRSPNRRSREFLTDGGVSHCPFRSPRVVRHPRLKKKESDQLEMFEEA